MFTNILQKMEAQVSHVDFFSLKGLCHEMNNFFEGLKNQISTVLSVYAPIIENNFCCLVIEKKKIKFWLASMKMLTNCENPSSNPLACCGIEEAAWDSVNCSVSRR
jgi:hypothetical protein